MNQRDDPVTMNKSKHFWKTLGIFLLMFTLPLWVLPAAAVGLVLTMWEAASNYAEGNRFHSYDD
jgi:hypothetical protein